MPGQTITETNPKQLHKKPPFEERQQRPPGSEQEMRNRPDHGEDSYRGFNRLHDRVALITGGDSGIGKAVAIANAREGAHVDDDPAIRNYIKTVLERAGIQVLEAVDGVAALALYQSLSRSLDLVITTSECHGCEEMN